jgi:hypothetical protein
MGQRLIARVFPFARDCPVNTNDRVADGPMGITSRPADSRLLGVVTAVLVAIAFAIVLFLAIQLADAFSS